MRNLGGESLKFIRHNFQPVQNKLLNKKSDAETHFENLLIDFGEYYRRERGSFKYGQLWCYYDFYIPYYRIYVEIDGPEHSQREATEKDKEKERYVNNTFHYVVRFTNEEVLAMNKLTEEELIERAAASLCCDNRSGKKFWKSYKRYKKNIEFNRDRTFHDVAYAIGKEWSGRKIYMYDHRSGNYFEFDDVIDAKLRLEKISAPEIIRLSTTHEYKHCPATRRYVFGLSLRECEDNVAKVYY
jgi:hypothetical protein